jgi:Ca2+-binding RTX toxin-like protein
MAITVQIQAAADAFGSECEVKDYFNNSFSNISGEGLTSFTTHDTTQTDNSFNVDIDVIFSGIGFLYDNSGAITAGVVNEVDILPVPLGAIASKVTHLNIDATALYTAASTHDLATLDQLIFQAAPFNYTGGAGNDLFRGGGLNDVLHGGDGSDTLYGNGGNDVISGDVGADQMHGGAGNDKYFVDDANDQIFESNGEGTDAVYASVNYTLQAGSEIEYLRANAGGTGLTLTGNEYVNRIYGGGGDDSLDGGTGADFLFGGAGNDTYIVNQAGVHVIESDGIVDLGGGIDTVQSSVAFVLPSNVENLTITGSSNINGNGNSLDNVLTGNSGVNILKGLDGDDTLDGGGGLDGLYGGSGNDSYIVNNAGVKTIEMANSGNDTVRSSVAWVLGDNIENLTLTGTSNINGSGSALDNIVTGNSGNNTLNGNDGNDQLIGGAGNDTLKGGNGNDQIEGGIGKDVLNGGSGADVFLFNSAPDAVTNWDSIQDFEHLQDKVALEHTIFTALTTGVLPDSAFFAGTAAHDADDRVIYNSTNGTLSYDPDGTGAAAAVHFATVTAGITVTHDDFLIT